MTRHAPGDTSLHPFCPYCEVGIGEAHRARCDVARCLTTGQQRSTSCRCPRDVWTGRWPGTAECEEFGWMIGPGQPDLNRLLTTATWDPLACRWNRPIPATPTTDTGEPR